MEDSSSSNKKAQDLPVFVPCSRLVKTDWVAKVRQGSYNTRCRWDGCVELEIRSGTTREFVTATIEAEAAAIATVEEADATDAIVNVPTNKTLDQLMGLHKVEMQVFWLSNDVFLAMGSGSDDLDKESDYRLAHIVEMKWTGSGSSSNGKNHTYHVYCPTQLPLDRVEESVAAVDWVLLTFIAGGRKRQWTQMELSTRRFLRPCSASIQPLQKIVSAPHPGGTPRNVVFDYYGLTDDQWKQIYESFHPATRFSVTAALADVDNNGYSCLLKAIRNGYGPQRLAVRCGDVYVGTQMSDLGSALSSSSSSSSSGPSSVQDLHLSNTQGCKGDAMLALLSAVASSTEAPKSASTTPPTTAGGLTKLVVEYFPSALPGWDAIWKVAGACPALATVRVGTTDVERAAGEADPLDAMEAAAKSNRHLTVMTVRQQGRYYDTPEYQKRILPLVRSNRIRTLTRKIKECQDASWRMRLFAISLTRLRQSYTRWSARTCVSFAWQLLRQNPDLLEICSRVSDVLRRQWDDHMRAIAYHQERVSYLERRMALSGTEIPTKRPRYP